MRAYIVLILAILVPHLVLSHPGQSSSYINKVFARRARSSPKYVPSPRQVRFSRYIQEPELQEVQQQQSTEDVDLDEDFQQQQLVDNSYGAEKSTPKSAPSYSSYGAEKSTTKSGPSYTQAPIFSETSTARPVQQQKMQQVKDEEDEALPQLNQPLPDEFEDAELSQNYMPTQGLTYSPVKQMKERNGQRPLQQSYAPGYGPSNGQSSGLTNGLNNGMSYGGSAEGLGDEFGFEEGINSVDMMKNAIRGEPGKDYPVFASVPETGFKCSQQQYPGYYADVEAQCQVFHICQENGRANAFLCPNGTIFSQRHFVCVWWYEFDCNSAEQFYGLNAELYKETESAGARNGIVGGSVPSSTGKLSSPKENLNKMYMAQIDEFNGVTTSAPTYYSSGKTTLRSNGAFKATTQPIKYDMGSVESVTPSILDSQNYETTPYNLDEALGEEIHSETPLIESLSLTTNIPNIQSPKSYGASGMKGGNGNGNGNYYGSNKMMSTMADYAFGNDKLSSPKPSYGPSYAAKGLNGKSNGKTSPKMLSQLPESPVKSARNGGSSKSKSIYGNGNGNGLKMKSPAAANGYKPSYSPSYGLKQ